MWISLHFERHKAPKGIHNFFSSCNTHGTSTSIREKYIYALNYILSQEFTKKYFPPFLTQKICIHFI